MGFVSAEYTVVVVTPGQGPGKQPPEMPSAGAVTDMRVTKNEEGRRPTRDWVPLVIALFSAGLILYSGLLANTRSRNDTFRQLRERFHEVRGRPGFSEALKTTPPGVDGTEQLWVSPFKVYEQLKLEAVEVDKADEKQDATGKAQLPSQALQRVEAALQSTVQDPVLRDRIRDALNQQLEPSVTEQAWAWTLKLQESYWVNAFDEWYITTGGHWVRRSIPSKFTQWCRRTFGVYRALWDEYYREALSNTVNDNPMMMVALWHAYQQGHCTLDAVFAKDMWDITNESHGRVDQAWRAWAALRESYPQLVEVKRPSFVDKDRDRELPAGYTWLLGFGVLVLVASVPALLPQGLRVGGTLMPWVCAAVGAIALFVSGLEYWSSNIRTPHKLFGTGDGAQRGAPPP
jgi:hypothetical protein